MKEDEEKRRQEEKEEKEQRREVKEKRRQEVEEMLSGKSNKIDILEEKQNSLDNRKEQQQNYLDNKIEQQQNYLHSKIDQQQNHLENKIKQQQNDLKQQQNDLKQQQNDLKYSLEKQIVELANKINSQASLSHIVSVTNVESKQTALSSSIVDPGTIRSSKILKPPTFDGQTAWETYRFQFKAAARANGWNENEMAASLVVSLRGQAATVLQFLPQGAPSYTSLVQACFRDKIWPATSKTGFPKSTES
ncbi:trichohyalin-like [Diabrotica virgifera virgifera]|uniref:Uncharacterized protein n=1 Tax=Diabrotica virgifera virgifera TaxID=50390 RepID=A0ABM5K0B1_DIAVI|nr:trichohyalin-like [Diabrotica virgifera virgifera]